MRFASLIAWSFASATLAACSSSPEKIDAPKPVDAAVDAQIDAPAGPCGTKLFYTGDLVDFDSTTANFKGVFDALFVDRADATVMDRTSPNGRFELCINDVDKTTLDVTAPATAGYLPGILFARKGETMLTNAITARAIKTTRATSLGLDPAKAHLYVHLHTEVGAQPVTIDQTPGKRFIWDDAVWTENAGSPGLAYLFADLTGTSTTLSTTLPISGGFGPVPLEAGKVTYVTVQFFAE